MKIQETTMAHSVTDIPNLVISRSLVDSCGPVEDILM